MAHIEVDKREFDELVGAEIDEQRLHEDASMLGVHWNHVEGPKWDVEVYPNRPDLLSVEGLARAYRGFFDIDTGRKVYDVEDGDIQVEVDPSVKEVRPFIGIAVVRGLELTEKKINGLIQLQEKLHQTLGRRRDKLAIGLHDLETVEAPFTYRAVEPEKVSFTPLEYDREMQLGEILDEHEKGQEYAWILEDEDRYPLIEDSEGRVLSFPPIINNQLTEVETGTRDILVDVTGKDLETVKKALNIIATALAERGGDIETVEVDGDRMPEIEPGKRELDLDYFRSISGLGLDAGQVIERLERMKMGAARKQDTIEVEVPAYRTDVMHQYDLIEDVVIAHGYGNVEPELPEVDQLARERPVEDYTRLLRDTLQGTGALEAHTYILSNREKLFHRMDIPEEDIAEMSNALTEDYTAVRNWLLPSLMEVLQRNRHRSYPQKFYEVADVSVLDDSDTGASNRRKLAYVHSSNDVDYNDVRQVLQVLERDLGVEFEVRSPGIDCFEDGRAATVYLDGEEVGAIGEFSREVLGNWHLEMPAAGFELDVEKLLRLSSKAEHDG
ncbi:MAG: phenylalanine--tRNA ligase subunit beta [Candidatus Nanohaloarchaea archaeon]